MLWIIFALAAALSYALVNAGDKYAIGHGFKNPYVFLAFTVYPHILLLPALLTVDFAALGARGIAGAVIASGFYFYASLAYIRAMSLDEVTRVNLWFNVIPLFSLFLAWILLGEKITSNELMSFIFFIAGITVASTHSLSGTRFVGSRALVPLLIACVGYGFSSVIYRYLGTYDNMDIFIVQAIAMFFWALLPLLWKNFRAGFVNETKKLTIPLIILVLSLVALDLTGTLFNIKAFSLAPAALVNAFVGVQSLMLFAICLALYRYRPELLGEKFDRRNLLLKLAALVLILTGVWVLYLG